MHGDIIPESYGSQADERKINPLEERPVFGKHPRQCDNSHNNHGQRHGHHEAQHVVQFIFRFEFSVL